MQFELNNHPIIKNRIEIYNISNFNDYKKVVREKIINKDDVVVYCPLVFFFLKKK
jgi:hypothetical protein